MPERGGLRRRVVHAIRRVVAPLPPNAVDLGHATIGRYTYRVPTVHHYPRDSAIVRIGNFTSIAHDVEFLPGGDHQLDWVTTFPIHHVAGLHPQADGKPMNDIVVGNDVWIGRGARILGGVTIGDGAVVAAYSVVTKDVAPYAIVAGHPATFKRRRFPDDVCDALLRIAWWNWSDETVFGRADELRSPDVVRFVSLYDPGHG